MSSWGKIHALWWSYWRPWDNGFARLPRGNISRKTKQCRQRLLANCYQTLGDIRIRSDLCLAASATVDTCRSVARETRHKSAIKTGTNSIKYPFSVPKVHILIHHKDQFTIHKAPSSIRHISTTCKTSYFLLKRQLYQLIHTMRLLENHTAVGVRNERGLPNKSEKLLC